MGFWLWMVWDMEYQKCMGYRLKFPTNQVGNWKIIWGIRDYGLSELWVKRASAVLSLRLYQYRPQPRSWLWIQIHSSSTAHCSVCHLPPCVLLLQLYILLSWQCMLSATCCLPRVICCHACRCCSHACYHWGHVCCCHSHACCCQGCVCCCQGCACHCMSLRCGPCLYQYCP